MPQIRIFENFTKKEISQALEIFLLHLPHKKEDFNAEENAQKKIRNQMKDYESNFK